jgi:hypothetical protein
LQEKTALLGGFFVLGDNLRLGFLHLMRLKLFLRRLTISSPRMAIRSAMPWPVRWVFAALVLGFCAAISLWAFEFGKDIAGLDRDAKEELLRLRTEVAQLRLERDKAQSVVNTSGSLLTAERSAQAKLMEQIKTLEADNRTLRDDLGFFEKLIPGSNEGIAIRGLHAEILSGTQLKWQVLVIQAVRNAPEFNGRYEISMTGVLSGRPWTAVATASGGVGLKLQQYRRLEGLFDIPPQVVVKSVTVKILDGNTTRANQTLKL